MNACYYRCSNCKKTYSRDEVRYLCPVCSKTWKYGAPLEGVLETLFDYKYIHDHFDKKTPNWSLFSAVDPKYYPCFPVGNTPFIRVPNLCRATSFSNLWIKYDGLNPSGSLKDRASFLVVAEANRLSEEQIIAASTGNAASALAAVCAAAGKKAIIFVPEKAPRAKLVQMLQYGAKVTPVKGTYDDAFRISIEYSKEHGGLNRNTAYHPLTIEGKKTVGLEIWAGYGFQVPDAILVPVGDGVIISGVYKAFYDLKESGLIDRLPKIICVQAESSDAIHRLITTGKYAKALNPATVADSISVSVPSNPFMAKKAVEESAGFSLTVSDDEILEGQLLLSRTTGLFAEPSSASVVAALEKIKAKQMLKPEEAIVLLITGHGLKDIDSAVRKLTVDVIHE